MTNTQNSPAIAGPLEPSVRLRRADWEVRTVELRVAQDLVRRLHYSGGGANTATYRHGLFRKGHDECLGVAWWIPPTKTAANATWPADWQGVLALTRLCFNGHKFVTYEVYTGNIDRGTRDATVRGLQMMSLANQRKIRVKNGAAKTATQLAKELGITEARVRQIRKELL